MGGTPLLFAWRDCVVGDQSDADTVHGGAWIVGGPGRCVGRGNPVCERCSQCDDDCGQRAVCQCGHRLDRWAHDDLKLSTDVGSATIYDYWDPSTAVQGILNGAAMDVMKIAVNGDFQEFEFSGASQDLLDSVSFTTGQGGLTQFPAEPTSTGFDYTVVPGT